MRRKEIYTKIILPTLGLIVTFGILKCSINSCIRSDKEFRIKYIPQLSAQILGKPFFLRTKVKDRIDDIAYIPISVFNNSDVYAYAISLDISIRDGTGREINLNSLNEYYREFGAIALMGYREKLFPREQWGFVMFVPLAASNSKEKDSIGRYNFTVKIQLIWKDAKGKEYKFKNFEQPKFE
mgnify:CR=1 FL=1